MKILSFFTKLLHFFPTEFSHFLALKSLKFLHVSGLLKILLSGQKSSSISQEGASIKHLNLENRLGFAAGLDKNGDYIDCLAGLGVGFIEVGTVTPKPQNGNPKPRLFRNRKERSLINRLGFNNKGVDHLIENLKNRKSNVVVGTSIGKNFDTTNDEAHKDYLFCLEKVYDFSDYIAVNISSPNTSNLRDLSNASYSRSLLSKIKSKQDTLSSSMGYKPIFIKLSPDEELNSLRDICHLILELKLDGIICSNTTVDHFDRNGAGGLSGAPLREKSLKNLKHIKNIVGNKIPVIASGGVMSVEDYQEKIEYGADLVQVYTGFIYEGPKLIYDLVNSKI